MATIRGGAKADAALRKVAELLGKRGAVRVGFLEGATYPTKAATPVAAVAAYQNFGTRRIPPRPFFSNMVAEESPGWPGAVATNLRSTGYDVDRTLNLVGEGIAGQLRQSIVDTNSPPLAQSTIDRKGSSKPLVDTGHMLNTVDYEVKT